jgi:hypothetical protein
VKFVSKFKLEIPLAWQGCVAPGHDFLLGIRPSVPPRLIQRLNYLAVTLVVIIFAANRNILACHAVLDLTPSWSEELLGDNHRQASRRLTLFLNKASTDA